MSSKRIPAAASAAPVRRRVRQDGWTPARQEAFIAALAQSACVTEACAHVGLSKQSAYALRTRPDQQGFRVAWDAALDLAIRRLTDECLSRALNGVPVPHFYQGQQVGEHRRYDNRLAMFLLRYRDPLRYAASLDRMIHTGHPEGAALAYARACQHMTDAAHGFPVPPVDLDQPPWAANAAVEQAAPPPPPERDWRAELERALARVAPGRAGG